MRLLTTFRGAGLLSEAAARVQRAGALPLPPVARSLRVHARGLHASANTRSMSGPQWQGEGANTNKKGGVNFLDIYKSGVDFLVWMLPVCLMFVAIHYAVPNESPAQFIARLTGGGTAKKNKEEEDAAQKQAQAPANAKE